MAMTKPGRPAAAPVKQIEDFLGKGGSVAADKAPAKTELRLPIRFPSNELRQRVDHARNSNGVDLPANKWVLLAISEKLARDGF